MSMQHVTRRSPSAAKTVETLRHDEASRKNIPTAEYQSVLQKEQESPVRVAYERRNRDLDPSSSGAARMNRTGATSSSRPRRSTSRRRSSPRC